MQRENGGGKKRADGAIGGGIGAWGFEFVVQSTLILQSIFRSTKKIGCIFTVGIILSLVVQLIVMMLIIKYHVGEVSGEYYDADDDDEDVGDDDDHIDDKDDDFANDDDDEETGY